MPPSGTRPPRLLVLKAVPHARTGTHTGEFMGVPVRGDPVNINAMDIVRFRGDQCVDHWGVMDVAGALAQMGAGPNS